jgi:hypothetical protein
MALASPGVQVTVTNEKPIPSDVSSTIPLLFVATKYAKTIGNTNITALGTVEAGVVRLVTSVQQSIELYGTPVFYTDVYGQPQHGDCRNEYGLLALNKYLRLGNQAYVIRADIDMDDSSINVSAKYDEAKSRVSTRAKVLLQSYLNDRNTNIEVSADRKNRVGGWVERPTYPKDANGVDLSWDDIANAGWSAPYPSSYFALDGSEFKAPNTYRRVFEQYYEDLYSLQVDKASLEQVIKVAIQEAFATSTIFNDKYKNYPLNQYNFSSIVSGNYSVYEQVTSLDSAGRPITAAFEYVPTVSGDDKYTNILATEARWEGYVPDYATAVTGVLPTVPTNLAANNTDVFVGILGKVYAGMLNKVNLANSTVGTIGGVAPATLPYIKGISPNELYNLVVTAFDDYKKTKSYFYTTSVTTTNSFADLLAPGVSINDTRRRMEIVKKLAEVINCCYNTSLDFDPPFELSSVTSDSMHYNVVACPGFPELTDELIALSEVSRNEVFVVGDVPMNLSPRDVIRWGKLVDQSTVVATAKNIRANNNGLHAYYYPHPITTNIDGAVVFAPSSIIGICALTVNDMLGYPWTAPAGPDRGVVDSRLDIYSVGYVDGQYGTPNVSYHRIRLNEVMTDGLYSSCNINPITDTIQYGLAVWGQKTRTDIGFTGGVNRINVARLVMYIRYALRTGLSRFLMRPNDDITRKNVTAWVTDFLHDIQVKRGLYDFAVLCDATNNTPSTTDRNELWVQVALKPSKAIEFIYVPINLLNTSDPVGF